MKNRLKIAMYLRLSKEDDWNAQESNSISYQRLLLRGYIERNFENYEILEFVDDGYSGTSMDRPTMQELLAAARQKKVDCIIVKDFSRFARDYVETGFYVEQIFPFLGIRFISVNDHYDSEAVTKKTIGMNLAFKTLVNDLYSKDLSVKVTSSLHSKKERGIYCSGNCPFGYRKKAEDRNQVEIVEEEAAVVREIFRLTLEGYTSVDIAKKFHKEKVKTPVEYLIERGATHRKPVGKEFSWQHTTICTILKNHFYAGDMVYGKYKKDKVGGKNHLKPRSEWKITYNHHEPIIEREVFDAVQQTRGISKPYQPQKAHILIGKVVCGECGKALRYRKAKNPYFYCNERYTTGDENCVSQVNVFFLEQVLLAALQKEIRRQMELEEVWSQYQEVQKEKYHVKRDKLQKSQQALDAVGKEQITLYERYGKREIQREEYIEFREELQKKEDFIKSEIQEQEMRLAEVETEFHAELPDAHIIWKECKINELNQEVVDTFIKKINVWDEQHMEIIWNFSDGKE